VSAAPLAGRLALARSGTDRVAVHRGDDAWLSRAWHDERTRVLLVGEGRTLAADGQLSLLPTRLAPAGERYLLGVEPDGSAYFAVDVGAAPQPPVGSAAASVGLRDVGTLLPDRDVGLLVLAIGLSNWHATHVRCPRCGGPTEVRQAGFVRRCPSDGSEHYPRTDPAVIMLVTDTAGDRALLGSSTRWPGRRFSTLAGFVEPGESAEAAVIREVEEESGVRVGDVTYLGSQPWPFPSSLMLGFTARALAPDAEPVADGVELAEVRWFGRDELAEQVAAGQLRLPPPVSIARLLVEHWYGALLPSAPEGSW
jgi:NAD+ diphosphatase